MANFSNTLPEARSARFFFRRQWLHLLALALLLVIAYAFAAPALGDGAWLDLDDNAWYGCGVGLAIAHQALVWLVWRAQLGWGLLTRLFGRADLAFWGALFLPLLVARPFLLFGLAMADRGSAAFPAWLGQVLGIVLLLPAGYTLWSVGHYFGLARALGGDHFRQRYREMPLVRLGAFRWSSNAMYTFGFLALWAIPLILGSLAGLSLALFQHAYIWVHYYCTEQPDMAIIYEDGARHAKRGHSS